MPDITATLGNMLQAIGYAFLPLLLLPFALLLTRRLDPFATTLCDLVDAFNSSLGRAVMWLLPLLVLSVVFTVFALSIFGWASTKMDESAKYLHATAIMLGAASALLANEHVRVDVLYLKLPARAKALVDFAGFYILLAPLMLAILWESQSATAFSWAILEGSPDADGLRGEFLLKTLIPVFAITMIAQGLSIAARAAKTIRQGGS